MLVKQFPQGDISPFVRFESEMSLDSIYRSSGLHGRAVTRQQVQAGGMGQAQSGGSDDRLTASWVGSFPFLTPALSLGQLPGMSVLRRV